jgi:hypothetical protein
MRRLLVTSKAVGLSKCFFSHGQSPLDSCQTRNEKRAEHPAMLRLCIPRPRPTLPCGDHAVPSALEGLTAVFGMGTGVSPPPWRPETLLTALRRVLIFDN